MEEELGGVTKRFYQVLEHYSNQKELDILLADIGETIGTLADKLQSSGYNGKKHSKLSAMYQDQYLNFLLAFKDAKTDKAKDRYVGNLERLQKENDRLKELKGQIAANCVDRDGMLLEKYSLVVRELQDNEEFQKRKVEHEKARHELDRVDLLLNQFKADGITRIEELESNKKFMLLLEKDFGSDEYNRKSSCFTQRRHSKIAKDISYPKLKNEYGRLHEEKARLEQRHEDCSMAYSRLEEVMLDMETECRNRHGYYGVLNLIKKEDQRVESLERKAHSNVEKMDFYIDAYNEFLAGSTKAKRRFGKIMKALKKKIIPFFKQQKADYQTELDHIREQRKRALSLGRILFRYV